MHECGQREVVTGNAEPLQVIERPAHFLGAQAGNAHQLVGGDSFIRVRGNQRRHYRHQRGPIRLNHVDSVQSLARLLYRADAQGGRKHLHHVLVALQQTGFLKPRNRRAHACVVRRRIALELAFVVFRHYLASGSDDHSAQMLAVIDPTQRFQDRSDFLSRKPGSGR